MGFNNRTPSPVDPAVDPLLPQADSSQPHDIPTGVSPTTAKLQDWIAWISANGVFFSGGTTINSDITVNGDLIVTLTLDVSGAADFGSSVAVGTDLTVGDDLTVTDDLTVGGDVLVSPARTWTRHSFRMCGTTGTGVDPFSRTPDSIFWLDVSDKGPALYTRSVPSSAARTLIEFGELPHGQTISSVVLRTVGVLSTAAITTAASYKVVRWQSENDLEDMSSSVNDSHTTGNFHTTVLAQTVTVTSNSTIDKSYRYGVEITHHDVDSNRNMITWGATAAGTWSSVVV